MLSDECRGGREQLRLARVAANDRQRRKLFEAPVEGVDVGVARSARNAELAFQCAGLRGRLLRRLLGFRRQIGRQPVHDAALQGDGLVALPQQLGRDM